MAITVVSKPKESKPKAVDDSALLAELGLAPKIHAEPPPEDYDLSLSVGDTVQVNHSLFPHIKDYAKGSTGVIKGIYPARIDWKDKARYDIIEVALSEPITDKKLVALSRWELSKVGVQ